MLFNKEIINYSLRNLNKNKSRSFLTILSIFAGISAIFIFISFGWGLYNYVNSFASGSSENVLLIETKGIGFPGMDTTFRLDEGDLREVKRIEGIKRATGIYYKSARISYRDETRYSFLVAYDPEIPLIIKLSNVNLKKGRFLHHGDKGKVFLGYNYLLDNKIFSKGLDLGDRLVVQGKKLQVVGFLDAMGNPQDDSNIYITNDYLNTLFPENNSYGTILAEVKDVKNIKNIAEQVEERLRKHRNLERGKEDFFVSTFEDLINTYSGALNIVIIFVILIALISVVVSAINTANTMITSVLERYKEIGVLKAIGARNSEIFKIFLFESSFLGFIAGIIGVLVGWGITLIARAIIQNLGFGFLSPYSPPFLFIGCILFAVLTGAISGVAPAINASRINAVDALRYE